LDAQLDAGFESASGFRTAYSKIFGEAPSKSSLPPLFIDWLETPMGRMIAITDEAALYLLEFTNRKNMRRQFDRLRKVQNRAPSRHQARISSDKAGQRCKEFRMVKHGPTRNSQK